MVDFNYSIDPDSVLISNDSGCITSDLIYSSWTTDGDTTGGSIASQLTLKMCFYQNGIMRVIIDEPNSERFKISDSDLPVNEEQLISFKNL